jgi:SAM-dependent methyltransferase
VNIPSKKQGHYGPELARKGEYTIIDCTVCGFAHCLPVPEREKLSVIYKEDYYGSVKPDYIALNEEDRSWHESTSNARLNMLETLTKGRRLLEIGSGPGLFLQCARKRGWDVLGFEPSRQAWQYSTETLGISVRNECFSPIATDGEKFDVAYLALVLEHIPDPRRLIEDVKICLNPGGIICIAVPNDFSPIQRFLKEKRGYSEWWVGPPHHINYFNISSIKHLVETCGARIKKITSSFPIDICLLMGFDYTNNPELGRMCHSLRMRFESEMKIAGFEDLQYELYDIFSKYGIGREIVIYAQFSSL